MRWFETRGPVYPEDNYVVASKDELADDTRASVKLIRFRFQSL